MYIYTLVSLLLTGGTVPLYTQHKQDSCSFQLCCRLIDQAKGVAQLFLSCPETPLAWRKMGGATTETNQPLPLLTDSRNLQSAVTLSWPCSSTETI